MDLDLDLVLIYPSKPAPLPSLDVIDLSCIDIICSSTLLICMIGFSTVCIIMLYQFIIRIKSYGLLLIFSTYASCLVYLSTHVYILPPSANKCNSSLVLSQILLYLTN